MLDGDGWGVVGNVVRLAGVFGRVFVFSDGLVRLEGVLDCLYSLSCSLAWLAILCLLVWIGPGLDSTSPALLSN